MRAELDEERRRCAKYKESKVGFWSGEKDRHKSRDESEDVKQADKVDTFMSDFWVATYRHRVGLVI